jgi:hypothetical protein
MVCNALNEVYFRKEGWKGAMVAVRYMALTMRCDKQALHELCPPPPPPEDDYPLHKESCLFKVRWQTFQQKAA